MPSGDSAVRAFGAAGGRWEAGKYAESSKLKGKGSKLKAESSRQLQTTYHMPTKHKPGGKAALTLTRPRCKLIYLLHH
jgi:hypothetical protein